MAVFITSDNQVAGYCNTMRARSIDRERERESESDELIKTGDENCLVYAMCIIIRSDI